MMKAGPIWALGAMSGTSLDGVDAALVHTDGEVIHAFGGSGYRAYSEAEQLALRAALGKWQDDDCSEALQVIQQAHTGHLGTFEGAALIGFHGQTLAHDPHGRGTHQIGDGAALANALDCPVVWDFRTADVRLGGEGAPLAPFYHFACAKWIGAENPVAFLNLGGVGNLTWVDPQKKAPDTPGALLAFDTGPANAPINDLMMQRLGRAYDQDGALATQGNVVVDAVEQFLLHPYFDRLAPKSLDRDEFTGILELVAGLPDSDAAATLTMMCAAAVARGLKRCPSMPERVLVTGGGRKNPVLMHMLNGVLEAQVDPVEAVGLDGDMLEAQAFAHLAVRVQRGLPTSGPGTTGVRAAVSGGTISKPSGKGAN
ncbi:anhydro-N-acetylmuramic acid kinase [Roseovarius sp. EL26]|uniref:anhydro-N-acetylmuramic acid kinase n=1 Tax=Roseovarius sp. EL26 TaxID=2126672 RepID=UPI000EA20317|nr:anhydro-N-acetylmuramic acid kinase [Roseovarius sp. EL26]